MGYAPPEAIASNNTNPISFNKSVLSLGKQRQIRHFVQAVSQLQYCV
ncbi:hypothetical protein [Nostoc sp.]